MTRATVGVALVMLMLGCGGGDDDGGGGADAAGGGGGDGAAAGIDGASASCSRTLTMGALTFDPICYLEEHVSGETVTAALPCDDGPITVPIGGVEFTGEVRARAVELTYSSQFTWTDGCVWAYVETISGDLDSAAWTYTYRDSLEVDCGGKQFECPGDAPVSAAP